MSEETSNIINNVNVIKDINTIDNENNFVNIELNSIKDNCKISKSTSKLSLIEPYPNENSSIKGNRNEFKQFFTIYALMKSLSQGSLHTFLLSIFETSFFWLYITKIEKKAILNKLEYISIILSAVCSSIYESELSQKISEIFEQKKYHKRLDNTAPFRISILLSGALLVITIFTTYITRLLQLIIKDNDKINTEINTKSNKFKFVFHELLESMPLLILICIYESLFFQMVVKTYEPITTKEFTYKVLNLCM